MKATALVFLTVLVLGVFYISQKKHNTSSIHQEDSRTDISVTKGTSKTETTPIQKNPAESKEILLTISEPQSGSTVSSPNLLIKGKTVPNADVFVNDVEKLADSSGNFVASVLLDEGENIVTITANDDLGNYSEKEFKVTLQTTDSLTQ